MSDIYVATKSATLFVGNKRHKIIKDVTRVRAGHPLLEGREAMFKPIDVHYDLEEAAGRGERDVEQATAAPGEQRTTVNPDKDDLIAQAQARGHDVDKRTSLRKLRELLAEESGGD